MSSLRRALTRLMRSGVIFTVALSFNPNPLEACLPPEPGIDDVSSLFGDELPINALLQLRSYGGLPPEGLESILTITDERGEALSYELLDLNVYRKLLLRISSPLTVGEQITVTAEQFYGDTESYTFTLTEALEELSPSALELVSVITDRNQDAVPGNSCQPAPVINRERYRSAIYSVPRALIGSRSMIYVNGLPQGTLGPEGELRYVDRGEHIEVYTGLSLYDFGEVFGTAGPAEAPESCLNLMLVSPTGLTSEVITQCGLCLFQTYGVEGELLERVSEPEACGSITLSDHISDLEEPTGGAEGGAVEAGAEAGTGAGAVEAGAVEAGAVEAGAVEAGGEAGVGAAGEAGGSTPPPLSQVQEEGGCQQSSTGDTLLSLILLALLGVVRSRRYATS